MSAPSHLIAYHAAIEAQRDVHVRNHPASVEIGRLGHVAIKIIDALDIAHHLLDDEEELLESLHTALDVVAERFASELARGGRFAKSKTWIRDTVFGSEAADQEAYEEASGELPFSEAAAE